jgi:hypothetical protein
MRWAEHVACVVKGRGAYKILLGKPEGKSHLEDLSVDGRIILKWIFKTWDEDMNWIDQFQGRDRWQTVENGTMNLCVL